MELTEKTFRERLNRIKEIAQGQDGQLVALDKRWCEKGVECAIIMPLLEIVMGFDFFDEVEFEASSTDFNNQRMDFIIDGKFIIEAKRISEDIGIHIPQVDRYMKTDSVKFAILTNGIRFMFFMKNEYISEMLFKMGACEVLDDCMLYLKERWPEGTFVRVLDMSYSDIGVDSFLKVISAFSQSSYMETFDKIARYALAYYGVYGKKNLKISSENKVDSLLKRIIEDSLPSISKGYYYGKEGFNIGDVLIFDQYENEGVKIVVAINKDWGVDVILDECDYSPIKVSRKGAKYGKVKEVFERWVASENISYANPAEIIKELKGNKKIMHADADDFIKV